VPPKPAAEEPFYDPIEFGAARLLWGKGGKKDGVEPQEFSAQNIGEQLVANDRGLPWPRPQHPQGPAKPKGKGLPDPLKQGHP
jgi:hypothetical protein